MSEDERNERRDELESEAPRKDPRDDESEGADEEPQPWAKALPGDEPD